MAATTKTSDADMAAERIDMLAREALIKEACAAPKPGLVDSRNSGAHSDMDIKTFMASAEALHGYFGACHAAGFAAQGQPQLLLARLQQLGLGAEARMYEATSGVNTHKGAVFSLGILCGAAGLSYARQAPGQEAVRQMAAQLCSGMCKAAFAGLEAKPQHLLTHGEKVYLEHGVSGARGEAEGGFATVGNISWPVYAQLCRQGFAPEEALVETLLYLIAYTADTNILARHGRKEAAYARRAAQNCLAQGGYLGSGGFERVVALDEDFTKRGISPGGSADLLAATYFLYELENRKDV